MKNSEMVKVHGIFEMRVYKHGALIEEYKDHNLVVDVARAGIASLISGDASGSPITHIGFGTNGTPPAAGDIALTDQLLKAIASHSFPAAGQVSFIWNLTTAEGNGKNISEFGLICADGSLFARKNRAAALAKDSDISLSGTWTIQF